MKLRFRRLIALICDGWSCCSIVRGRRLIWQSFPSFAQAAVTLLSDNWPPTENWHLITLAPINTSTHWKLAPTENSHLLILRSRINKNKIVAAAITYYNRSVPTCSPNDLFANKSPLLAKLTSIWPMERHWWIDQLFHQWANHALFPVFLVIFKLFKYDQPPFPPRFSYPEASLRTDKVPSTPPVILTIDLPVEAWRYTI
jgi:hypothetical protein